MLCGDVLYRVVHTSLSLLIELDSGPGLQSDRNSGETESVFLCQRNETVGAKLKCNILVIISQNLRMYIFCLSAKHYSLVTQVQFISVQGSAGA